MVVNHRADSVFFAKDACQLSSCHLPAQLFANDIFQKNKPGRGLKPSPVLPATLNVNSAIPDLSSSPKPSATMREYCFFVAVANGKFKPFSLAQFQGDPGIFRRVRRREKTRMVAVLHVLAVGSQNLRRRAGLRKKSPRTIARSRPSASASPSPSARPAVLMFITIFTSALTSAALPAEPTNRMDELSRSKIGRARSNAPAFRRKSGKASLSRLRNARSHARLQSLRALFFGFAFHPPDEWPA